jgi:DNA-binding response OmpR family regulator
MSRILVVDDSPTVHFQMERQLGADGHVVDRLEAFTQLGEYMRQSQPDLILLDLEMPALSGEAFAKFVRRIERAPTRILVHSSLPIPKLAAAAERIGATGYVPKGATPEELRRAVRTALSATTEELRRAADVALGRGTA